jgi:hypothetical protein
MKETELYEPVRQLLIDQGFSVKAEINNIDVLGVKDNHLVAVELKTKLSIKLIYQAIDRQKLVDQVYIAIPKSSVKRRSSSYKNLLYLLKRLELGLIMVDQDYAEVYLEVSIYDMARSKTRNKKRKENLLKEFGLRKYSKNVGGTKNKTVTRYKEEVIEIAMYLLSVNSASPKEIKKITNIDKTASILQKNYQGYFKRIERGIYGVVETKIDEIIAMNTMLKENKTTDIL